VLRAFEQGDLYRATPTVIWGLDFSGLIQKPPHSVASYDTLYKHGRVLWGSLVVPCTNMAKYSGGSYLVPYTYVAEYSGGFLVVPYTYMAEYSGGFLVVPYIDMT
jgi:hypothetical protein